MRGGGNDKGDGEGQMRRDDEHHPTPSPMLGRTMHAQRHKRLLVGWIVRGTTMTERGGTWVAPPKTGERRAKGGTRPRQGGTGVTRRGGRRRGPRQRGGAETRRRGEGHTRTPNQHPLPLRATARREDTGCGWRRGDDAQTRGMTAQHPAPTTASTRSQGGLGANGHVTSPDAYACARRSVLYAYVPAVSLHERDSFFFTCYLPPCTVGGLLSLFS